MPQIHQAWGEERELGWGTGAGHPGRALHGETEPGQQVMLDKSAGKEWPVRHQTNPTE